MYKSLDNSPLPTFFSANGLSTIPSESEKKILSLILRGGEVSQPGIARHTKLAQQSVSRLVKGLMNIGALTGDRQASGRRGQPSMTVRLNPSFAYSFGIAMMTDAFSVVLMDFSGKVLDEIHCDMLEMTRRVVIPKIKQVLESTMQKHAIKREHMLGIGVGISGYSLGGQGRYNTPKELDDWALVALEDVLADYLGYPVWVENDANAAAIGESLIGHGRNYDNFAYLYVAAGIGGGIIVNRELLRGCHGNGGEIGLMLPANMQPYPTMELLREIVVKQGFDVNGISDLLTKFNPEWPAVDEWVKQTQDSLSLIVSSLSAILDTDAIVFGGRIPQELAEKAISHINIFDDTRRELQRRVPRLLISRSHDGGAVGAAALPLHDCFFSGTY